MTETASPTPSKSNWARCPVSPPDQSATFIELFFDLVFVFSITQLVHFLHHGLDWAHAGQAVLIFWLVWWAWTQFTWALNAADTTHTIVEGVVLLATAAAFFMAISLPHAVGDKALWFAGAYVAVRIIGLGLYLWVTAHDKNFRSVVLQFAGLSLLGLACVLVGAYLGGAWQMGLWGAALVADLFAALMSGSRSGWDMRTEHFAERHGLFVIIALGEGIIVAAHGLEVGAWDTRRLGIALLAVTTTCGLWWTYFARAKAHLEEGLNHTRTSSAPILLGMPTPWGTFRCSWA